MDLDDDLYGGLSAARFFTFAERLPAYEGAVAARIHHLMEEAKKRSPSRAALEQGAQQSDSAAAVATALPEWVEYSAT